MTQATGPRTVLWLTKGLGLGGTERLLVDVVTRVDPARYRVEVAYVLAHKDALVPELAGAGVPVHLVTARPRVTWPSRLRRLVSERGVELVHTQAPLPASVARVAVPRQLPMVHTEHNVWARYRTGTRWANRLTLARNRSVIAVSQPVAASIDPRPRLRRGSGPAIETLVHGIDPATIANGPEARRKARAELGVAEGSPVIGTVGNLTAKKNQSLLLEAAARLRLHHPELVVVVVGSGPLDQELRSRADALGLDGAVRFCGARPDVAALLAAFDVFSLTSRYEGLPIALLEAMAAGLPSVVTAVGGIPDVVTDQADALLVTEGDTDAFVAAADRLLRAPAERRRLGERARARALQFDLSGAVSRTQEIYDQVLGTARIAT